MLEDGFSSDRYRAILGNLRDNEFLNKKDVEALLEEFITLQKTSFDGITDEKAKIVSEALIDNYNSAKVQIMYDNLQIIIRCYSEYIAERIFTYHNL